MLYMSHISIKENKMLKKYLGTLYKLSSIKKQEMQKKVFPQNRLKAQVASSDFYQTFKVEIDAHLLTHSSREQIERIHLTLPLSDQEITVSPQQ